MFKRLTEPDQSKESHHVFVSYRGSRKDLAVRISRAVAGLGWTTDTLEEYLNVPFPKDSPHEFKWLTDQIAERILPGSTFVMMASDDADESHWVLFEGLEGFLKAYRVIVCWVSGSDPLKVVFPLSKFQYRFMQCPQAFIVDARGDHDRAVEAVSKILEPSRRYRIFFRIQQAVTAIVCVAMAISPATVLLLTSVLPVSTASAIRSMFLRPWVALFLAWLSMIVVGIFYPSYGGPSRLAPTRIDRYIRLATPGFTGWRWRKLLFPISFILACMIDGISFFTIKSMSIIGWRTYLKVFIIYLALGLLYEKVQWNLFSVHVGRIYRRLAKHYGVELSDLHPPSQAPR